jgi:hypothetical protein
MGYDDVLAALVEACDEDWVGLYEVVRIVRGEVGTASAEQVRLVTVPLLRALLEEHEVVAGFPHYTGVRFLPWEVPSKEALDRIDFEWSALGRDPVISEVAWFSSTELID